MIIETNEGVFERRSTTETVTLVCPCGASISWSKIKLAKAAVADWGREHQPHTTIPENPYPEHDKLSKVKDESQTCGEFLDWLLSSRGYTLGQYHVHSASCYDSNDDPGAEDELTCTTSTEFLFPAPFVTRKLLAEFFKIDEGKLEDEKRRMLAGLRSKS